MPLLHSVSNISVDNMHIMYSVFLDILSEVFVGVLPHLQSSRGYQEIFYECLFPNTDWFRTSTCKLYAEFIIPYAYDFITEL